MFNSIHMPKIAVSGPRSTRRRRNAPGDDVPLSNSNCTQCLSHPASPMSNRIFSLRCDLGYIAISQPILRFGCDQNIAKILQRMRNGHLFYDVNKIFLDSVRKYKRKRFIKGEPVTFAHSEICS